MEPCTHPAGGPLGSGWGLASTVRGRGHEPAPTDELHGRQPQVPVGAAQVNTRLHEKLVAFAKVALHLGRRTAVGRQPEDPVALASVAGLCPRPPRSPAEPRPERRKAVTWVWAWAQGPAAKPWQG